MEYKKYRVTVKKSPDHLGISKKYKTSQNQNRIHTNEDTCIINNFTSNIFW